MQMTKNEVLVNNWTRSINWTKKCWFVFCTHISNSVFFYRIHHHSRFYVGKKMVNFILKIRYFVTFDWMLHILCKSGEIWKCTNIENDVVVIRGWCRQKQRWYVRFSKIQHGVYSKYSTEMERNWWNLNGISQMSGGFCMSDLWLYDKGLNAIAKKHFSDIVCLECCWLIFVRYRVSSRVSLSLYIYMTSIFVSNHMQFFFYYLFDSNTA